MGKVIKMTPPQKETTFKREFESKEVKVVYDPAPPFELRNCCLVSFAETAEQLCKIERLKSDVLLNWQGQTMYFDHYSQIVPNKAHIRKDQDYKLLSVSKAFANGYTQIIFVEPSIKIVKDLQPLFEFLNENTTIFQSSGKMIGDVANRDSLKTFNMNKHTADELNLFRTDMFGVDLGFTMAKQMFEFFLYFSQSNKIIGINQFDVILSLISQKVGMAQLRVDEWIADSINENCYFTTK